MIKRRKQLAAVLVVLCLLLVSCGTPEVKDKDAGSGYNDRLIEDKVFEGDFKEDGDMENTIPYKYHIPQIRADNKEVQEFNEQVMSIARSAESSEYLYYDDVSWSSCWNGSLLSLVLEMHYPFQKNAEYMTCNYDFEEERFLTNEELLERAGTTEKEFLKSLRRAVAKKIDNDNEKLLRTYRECGENLLDMRAQTLSENNLDPDTLPLYLDEKGRPCAAVIFATPAGAGTYNDIVTPVTGKDGVHKKKTCEFVTAELSNNEVKLTFKDTGLAGLFMPDSLVKFGKEYKVRGLYGTYTDMALGFIGNGGFMYMCLLDDEGRITVCDIMNGVDSGARFIAMGPFYTLKNIKSFRTESDDGGSSIYAVDDDGEEYDLYGYIAEAERQLHPLMENSTWAYDNGIYWLNMEDSGNMRLSWDSAKGAFADGNFYYLGMTEKGMVYGFYLVSGTEPVYGTLTLECHTTCYAPEGDNYLTLKQYTGPLLPGLPENGSVDMMRSWG